MKAKKSIPIFLKILFVIIFVLLLLFLIGALFFPAKVSSLTNGLVCGPGVKNISVKELESGEISALTEKEEKNYQKYVKNYQQEALRKLDSEQRELYEACLIIPDLMRGLLGGSIEANQDTIEDSVDELLESVNWKDSSKRNFLSSLFVTTVYAAEGDASSTFDATVFHNLAEALYLAKDYDLSAALAALTAVNEPHSAPTANLLGNLLKQNNDIEEALEMHQYALRCNPSNESTLIGAGNCCLDLEKYDLAASYFNRALSISGGGGPANQGMMLVSFARNDDGSAFLYMLEGAKEGYTSVLTDAYEYFRRKYPNREEYLKFCGPILDQYGFRNLTDFTRTRLAFDPTLDTPAQQLNLDRTFSLPKSGGAMIDSSLVSLYDGAWRNMVGYLNVVCGGEGLQAFVKTGQLGSLLNNPTSIYIMEELGGNLSDVTDTAGDIADTLLNGDGNLTDKLLGAWGTLTEQENLLGYSSPSSISADGDNYEQEVFWIRILTDYTEYKFTQIAEEYCDSKEEEFVFGPLDDSMSRLDQLCQRLEANASLSSWAYILSCFVTNGSFVADRAYTLEEVKRMGNDICAFEPYLKKGYLECVMLAEEYWLYTNNILGMIADDGIYNRMRAYRDYLTVRVATYFPMMAGTYYGAIGITAPGWAGVTWDWWLDFGNGPIYFYSALHEVGGDSSYVAYPKFPELPISGMGKEAKPELPIEIIIPDPQQLIDGIEDGIRGDDDGSGSDSGDGSGDGSGSGSGDGSGNANSDDGSKNPTLIITVGSGDGDSGIIDTDSGNTTEKDEETQVSDGFKIKFNIKSLFDFSYDPKTKEFSISVDAKIAGAKFAYDPKTDDIIVYTQMGFNFSENLIDAEPIVVDGVSVTSVAFLKGTLRTKDITTSSVESGVTVEANLLNQFGLGSTLAYDMISGVTKDTAHLLIDGKKKTLETEEKTGEGFLEIFDLSKWFKKK